MRSVSLVVTLAALVGSCGGGGGFPVDAAPDSPPPGGRLSLAWSLTDTAAQPITCGQVGGQVVTLILHNRAIQGASTEVFGCTTGSGDTLPVLPGTYDVSFELNGMVGLLATAPPQMAIVVESNKTTALAPVTFAVEAIGGLELSLASGKPGGNCAAVASNGAGITATTITLVHTGGNCEPVTFQISAGATKPASTYTVNCATPVVGPCIESDQKLTVSNVPSGGYQIHVRGKVGTTDCWINDDGLAVPPLSKILKQTLNLGQQPTPGC
ncbi:MAG TPA: hypothetical protein VFQ53_13115 [Kofleriaceae bacterium]|nr:hypothetical protein [Kofleriaceae bacterium]